VKKLRQYVKLFSSDTGTSQTDGRMDRIAISISHVSVLTHDKTDNRVIIGIERIAAERRQCRELVM